MMMMMMLQDKAKRARRRERGRFKQAMRKNAELWEGWKRSIKVEKGRYYQVFESPVFSLGNNLAGREAWRKDKTSNYAATGTA